MISDHFDDLYYIEKNPRPHYMSLDSIRISTCLKKKTCNIAMDWWGGGAGGHLF